MLYQTASNRISAADWLVLLPACFIVSAAVLLNAASSALRTADPSIALTINPLDAEARVDLAWQRLNANTNEAPAELRQVIAAGARLSPIDARFHSLMGILEERTGNRAAASRQFDHALALLPTEIQALAHKLAYDVEANDLASAVDHIEIIGRRWQEYWPMVEPALPAVLSNEVASEQLIERFASSGMLRSLLSQSLAKEQATLPFAYRVLMRWHQMGVPDLGGPLNHVTERLVWAKRYAEAFMLFILTRTPDAERKAGYVYNGEFRLPPSGNPFDWHLKSQAGVAFDFVRHSPQRDNTDAERKGEAAGGDGHQLVVRFLNTPIQFRNISQFTRLGPGEYRLALSYSVRDLAAPKPLQLAVRCVGSNENLTAIEFESGSIEDVEESADFTVPFSSCDLLELYIFNEPMPMSWRNRYSGAIHLNRIAISRPGG